MRIINLFCIFFILLGTTIVKAQEKSLATLINEKDVFLVDVRTPEEFAKGSAANTVNIPLNKIEIEKGQFQGKTNIILFCRAGRRAEQAKKILAKYNIEAVNGGTYQEVAALQKKNLLDQLSFRSDEQTVTIIKRAEGIKQVAVALGKGAVLKKHTTNEPAILVVIKGKLRFLINNQEILLNTFDTYDIPVDVEHEVIGVEEENVFILTTPKYFK